LAPDYQRRDGDIRDPACWRRVRIRYKDRPPQVKISQQITLRQEPLKIELQQPERPKRKTRTKVKKHDHKGRIQEYVTEEL